MTELLDRLQALLGYRFTSQQLLVQALTHRSYGVSHNERLEFLGDAILDLLVSEHLYLHFPQATEGELSHMRSCAVCGDSLAGIGKELGLGDCLYLGTGEASSGGRQRQSNIANALEALMAAVYLDGGMNVCREVMGKLFSEVLLRLEPGASKDSKTRLQEYLQARQSPLPEYRLLARTGSDHDASFTMECSVKSPVMRAEASASSRKKAEQLAAEKILAQLESVK